MRIDTNRPLDLQRPEEASSESLRRTGSVARARQSEVFESLLRLRSRTPFKSLRNELAELIGPPVNDPGIFSPGNSLQVLEHIIDTVLPRLDAEPEIKALAASLLEQEIQQRRELGMRLSEIDDL
ncbi:hypothetical protein [Pseudomonas sp.]|uniref:hypothetical protein n=1 Tax=Pseudomonas sp. TaxID=306 RepID=UPI0028987EA7|nr:hypothetical protein [Pseudomonas sp.]